jgi:septum formation protein
VSRQPAAILVLASSSPRRIEILRRAGVRFRRLSPRVDEVPRSRLGPLRYVKWAAAQKAEAVAVRAPGAVVIAADTVVVLDGRVYGKPKDDLEAVAMLTALSGRRHQVYTAVHVIDGRRGSQAHGFSRTQVTMRELSASRVRAYVRGGEAQDKAGAYAIQGEGHRLIESIRGPYDNVVGMPMRLLIRLLGECGIRLSANTPDGLQHYVTAQRRVPRSPLPVGPSRR